MQMSKLVLSALVAMSAFGGLYASSAKPQQKKIHLDSRDVSITDAGIAVRTQSGKILVNRLRHDQDGIFILERDIAEATKGNDGGLLFRQCSCGRWFKSTAAYWRHVDSGECPTHPKRR